MRRRLPWEQEKKSVERKIGIPIDNLVKPVPEKKEKPKENAFKKVVKKIKKINKNKKRSK
jgi:hypothetical protein